MPSHRTRPHIAGPLVPGAPIASLAMFASGMAWITTANALSVSAQLGLPNWVRARGVPTSLSPQDIQGHAPGPHRWRPSPARIRP